MSRSGKSEKPVPPARMVVPGDIEAQSRAAATKGGTSEMLLFPRGSIFRSDRQTTCGSGFAKTRFQGAVRVGLKVHVDDLYVVARAFDAAREKDDADGIDLFRRNPLDRGCLDHENAHQWLLQENEGEVLDECVTLVQGSHREPRPFHGFEDVDACPFHGRPALFRVPAGPVFRAGRANRAGTGPVSEGFVKTGEEGLPLRSKHPLLKITGGRFAFKEKGMSIVLKHAPCLLGRRRVGRARGAAEMGTSESASEVGPIGNMNLLDRDGEDAFKAEVADSRNQ